MDFRAYLGKPCVVGICKSGISEKHRYKCVAGVLKGVSKTGIQIKRVSELAIVKPKYFRQCEKLVTLNKPCKYPDFFFPISEEFARRRGVDL